MKLIAIASSIAVVLCLAQLTTAQVVSPGACPVHPVHQNFDVPRYLGLWYEYRRYEQQFQRDGECVTAQYSLNEDGSVRVFNSMMVPPCQNRASDTGRAVVAFPDEEPLQGKLNVTFPGGKYGWWSCSRDKLMSLYGLNYSSTGRTLGKLLGSGYRLWQLCRRLGLFPDRKHIASWKCVDSVTWAKAKWERYATSSGIDREISGWGATTKDDSGWWVVSIRMEKLVLAREHTCWLYDLYLRSCCSIEPEVETHPTCGHQVIDCRRVWRTSLF